jgi:uncharacterized phage-like protein YoqJ
VDAIRIAVSGHRPKVWNYDPKVNTLLYDVLSERVADIMLTYDVVMLSGMALGVDTIWARIAKDLDLELHAYVPCKNQESRWFKKDQKTYFELLDYAKEVIWITDGPYKHGCMQARNQRMCNDADYSIIVYNGNSKSGTAHYIRCCKGGEKAFEIIDLNKVLEVL